MGWWPRPGAVVVLMLARKSLRVRLRPLRGGASGTELGEDRSGGTHISASPPESQPEVCMLDGIRTSSAMC